MTKSQEKSIIERVNWIHKNRKITKEYKSEIDKINVDIDRVTNETIDVMEGLKKDMGDQTTMNIKIGGKYYTLTQKGCAVVEIEVLFMDIEC